MADRCEGIIEGSRRASGVVLWRKRCRNKAITGYRHCHHHLTCAEQERRDREQGRPWAEQSRG